MTKVEVMAMLATVKDISVDEWEDQISVTVEDFAGFDEEWGEEFRQYDTETIDAMEKWLEEHADSVDADYYVDYHFEDCVVCVGYASMDI